MGIRAIPARALDGYFSLVKWPLDAVARRTRRDADSTSPAELFFDRIDATVRDTAGRILGDEALQDDARRRRLAASERERALELRAGAEAKTEQADKEFARRHRAAEERRRSAERRAAGETRRIEQEKQAKERAVEQTAAQRTSASRKVASTVEGAVDDKADKSRLQQLQVEADALREEEKALGAEAKAKTLAKAAGNAKATRKNGT
jgi:hypothetical protein